MAIRPVDWYNKKTKDIEDRFRGKIGYTGHNAIRLDVLDPKTRKIILALYLDDGHIGGRDHVFLKNEIPFHYIPKAPFLPPRYINGGKPPPPLPDPGQLPYTIW